MATGWEDCPCAGERANKGAQRGRQEGKFQLTGHQMDVPTHGH